MWVVLLSPFTSKTPNSDSWFNFFGAKHDVKRSHRPQNFAKGLSQPCWFLPSPIGSIGSHVAGMESGTTMPVPGMELPSQQRRKTRQAAHPSLALLQTS